MGEQLGRVKWSCLPASHLRSSCDTHRSVTAGQRSAYGLPKTLADGDKNRTYSTPMYKTHRQVLGAHLDINTFPTIRSRDTSTQESKRQTPRQSKAYAHSSGVPVRDPSSALERTTSPLGPVRNYGMIQRCIDIHRDGIR